MVGKRGSLELVLSDEVQSLLDDFASLLDIRVTFFSLDGEPVRRGKAMCNSAFCTLVQQDDEGLDRCLRMDAEMRFLDRAAVERPEDRVAVGVR